MKWNFLTAVCAINSVVQAQAHKNKSSYSFAGSNSYYLHALLPSDQAAYIDSLRVAEAKVVRLWSMLK